MRNLMIGAVSALALMAGPALAQNADVPSKSTTSPTMTAPSTGMSPAAPSTVSPSTTSPATGLSTTAPGSYGSSTTTPPGSSGWSGQTTAPSGLGSATSSNPAADNQRATGTLCPPGTPNCKPDSGGSGQ